MPDDPIPVSVVPSKPRQSIAVLRVAYREGGLKPSDVVRAVLARIQAAERDEVWISRPADEVLLAQAAALDALLVREGRDILDRYPLFGLPFAVKDNIDVAGLPTTAACPEFAYRPERSAAAVGRLLDGHALCIGKTNLDQFATGLVGTRSPFGAVRNAVNPDYISGGSSSGSAVAVALGLVSFALGTDTAGSGRVPAGLNGIVGLKPSRGLVSCAGVVPACRSLDCVSIFAADVVDAWQVLQCIFGADPADPYSRTLAMAAPNRRGHRLGVASACEFYGDANAAAAYAAALSAVEQSPGLALQNVDTAPLFEAAELLYQGPWIAERRAALGGFLETGAALDPAVHAAVIEADRYSAVDAFRAEYRMADYRRQARALFDEIDALLLPTAAIHPLIAEVQAEPLLLNTRLGRYTNFVNLLDLAALAIPAGRRSDGLPFGLTLIGPAGSDHRLAVLGAELMARFGTGPADAARAIAANPLPFCEPTLEVAVVGAHLNGQPLNWQLLECGARLLATTQTSASYRLYALAGTRPAKPGLARVGETGCAIEVEVWEMPLRNFGRLMSQVGAPLGIGSLELADGRWVKGFICEPVALAAATDITACGGWRAYLATLSAIPRESIP